VGLLCSAKSRRRSQRGFLATLSLLVENDLGKLPLIGSKGQQHHRPERREMAVLCRSGDGLKAHLSAQEQIVFRGLALLKQHCHLHMVSPSLQLKWQKLGSFREA